MDLLPMTGVTFPFVSNGGTTMIASWGLLAFLKATDTRQNASFAIRLSSKKEDASCPLPVSTGRKHAGSRKNTPPKPASKPGPAPGPKPAPRAGAPDPDDTRLYYPGEDEEVDPQAEN